MQTPRNANRSPPAPWFNLPAEDAAPPVSLVLVSSWERVGGAADQPTPFPVTLADYQTLIGLDGAVGDAAGAQLISVFGTLYAQCAGQQATANPPPGYLPHVCIFDIWVDQLRLTLDRLPRTFGGAPPAGQTFHGFNLGSMSGWISYPADLYFAGVIRDDTFDDEARAEFLDWASATYGTP